MKNRTRPNLGLILTALLLIGAVVFSILTDTRTRRQTENALSVLRTVFEKETAALIFSKEARQDDTISVAELADAKANLDRVLAELYEDATARGARAEVLGRILDNQAERQFYLLSAALADAGNVTLQQEDHLLKFETDNLRINAEYYSGGHVQNSKDYPLSPGWQALFEISRDELTLLDQAGSAAGRFLSEQLGFFEYDDPERDMPWNRRRPF